MVIAVVLGCICMVAPAEAQLNTQDIKGTVGLKSGSQAPPGVYFIAPLFYVYKTDEVKDRDGVRLPFAADLTSQVYGGGGVTKSSAVSTASRWCFQLARTIGFRAPRLMPILGRV